jgi:predicted nucleotidyltransferase
MEIVLPEVAEPYRTALLEAVTFIRQNYDPVGIVAGGSILRGEGNATSDLDIYVIHTRTWRQRVQKWFNGIPAEIFINPPVQVRRYFVEERQEGRPVTAHLLATGHTFLATDPIVETLRAEARAMLALRPDLSPQVLTMKRYMAATALEDALDIWETDPANALFILENAMSQMVQYAYLAANRPLPRLKQTLNFLNEIDGEMAAIAHQFYTETELEARLQAAQAFAHRTVQSPGFFEWQSDPQEIS